MVLIACAQMCSTDNVAHNLAISVKLARDAAAAGATALFLPEAPDEAASEEPGSERVFNTHVSIGPDGKVKAFYRKLHLFDIQLKETDKAQAIPREKLPRTGEHKKIIPGSVIPEPVDMGDIGRVGLEICYDIRFPELHIILRRKGADIITLPSAFTVYVIAAAQAGAHSPQRSSWGEALVFDPWGVELGRLPSIDEVDDPTQPLPPQFILADVDLARVQIPLDIQKRDDVYGVVGANTFVGSSVAELELEHLGVLERIWRGVQSLFGYGSVRLPTAPSTETVVTAAGAGKQYY
ncbi:carbon-nitrogen hydrolase [Mycena olivaceomarginata]|nr:carbon-nitrogen hydrolase [Mycena olivaceomarginata]